MKRLGVAAPEQVRSDVERRLSDNVGEVDGAAEGRQQQGGGEEKEEPQGPSERGLRAPERADSKSGSQKSMRMGLLRWLRGGAGGRRGEKGDFQELEAGVVQLEVGISAPGLPWPGNAAAANPPRRPGAGGVGVEGAAGEKARGDCI